MKFDGKKTRQLRVPVRLVAKPKNVGPQREQLRVIPSEIWVDSTFKTLGI